MVIQLHGQFETTNYGDMLLCILFANYLHERGHQVIVRNACNELYEYLGEKVLRDGSPQKMVCCGGGYLCDGDMHFSLHMIKRIYLEMAMCRLKGISYAIIGAGSKPFFNNFTKPFMRWCIKGADVICVRNSESKVDLNGIGVKGDIKVTADNVMAIDGSIVKEHEFAKVREIINRFDEPKNKKILIHINYLPIDGNDDINRGGAILIDAIEKFATQNPEYNFIVMYDHKIETFEKQCDSIFQKLPEGRKAIIKGDTVDSVLATVYACDIIITTKLHVGITGVALNKNVISFPMHIKAKRFFSQINETGRCILLQECKSSELVLNQLEKYVGQSMNKSAVERVKEIAKYNFEILDHFIEG